MSLSESLQSIYENAHYDILLGAHRITLSTRGVVSGDVSLLFEQPVAIVTACNPSAGSDQPVILSDEENERAQRRLEEYLQSRGIEYYDASGYAGLHNEKSFALFGVSREQAASIGRRFGQAAIFYFDAKAQSRGEVIPCGEDTFSLIRRLPLIELHLHTEGSIPLSHLLTLVQRQGGEQADRLTREADLAAFLKYRNFYEFIQKWLWILSLIHTEEDYEGLVFRVMQSLHEVGVVHAELHFSPFDYTDGRLKPPAIAEAVCSGMRRAKAAFGMSGCMIADIVRNHPPETAIERIDSIAPFLGEELVAIGLGGDEAKFPPDLFTEAFAHARSRGFRTVAHAGETAGASSIRKALVDLKAERIGHGIRCLEDRSLVEELVRRRTPLEVCLTSNEATGVIEDLRDHPIRKLLQAGLNVTLNSDDMTMFRTDLREELGAFVSEFKGTAAEIRQLLQNAVSAAFVSDSRRMEIQRSLLTA